MKEALKQEKCNKCGKLFTQFIKGEKKESIKYSNYKEGILYCEKCYLTLDKK